MHFYRGSTITFAQEQALRKILTILILFSCFRGAAQDDSLLQRLIDSVKTESNTKKNPPVAKDTQKPVIKPAVVKKDSFIQTPALTDTLFSSDTSSLLFADSVERDSAAVIPALPLIVRKPLTWQEDTAFQHLLLLPVSNISVGAINQEDGDLHKVEQKDYLFYALLVIVFLLAVTRQLFPKYFQNLFKLLFEASFRQKQRREQLMQEALPSLLMNILFVLVSGLFVAIMAYKRQWLSGSFWQITFSSITIISLVYLFKYAVIQVTGWIFNAREPATTYSFIVFLVNKIIGLALLPLLLLLAFSENNIWDVAVTIAACLVIFMLFFRYVVSLTIIRSSLSIHPLHFFIYLCAVEIMPMMVIFKLLFSFIGKSN